MDDHTIVPDKNLVKVASSFTAYNNNTTINPFAIYANSIYQPFTTASPITTTGNFTASNGSVITQNVIGYGAYSALYNGYRVRASRIRVYVMPNIPAGTTAENVTVVVYPSAYSAGTGSSTFNINANQRYAKWKTMNTYGNHEQNMIDNYLPSHKALGLTQQQFVDQPATVMGNAPSNGTDWFWVVAIINNITGAYTANTVSVVIQLEQYVELNEPLVQTT